MSVELIPTAAQTLTPQPLDITRFGYWNQQSEPRAVYHNGKTYIVWITEKKTIEIAAYDHLAKRLGPATVLATGVTSPSGDVHNSVALCVRSWDSRIIVAYCGEEAASVTVRISMNPEDISSWGSEIAVGSGGFTYVTLYQLPNEANAPLYLFSSMGTTSFSLAYAKSTDGGATWTAMQSLITPAGSPTTYWRIGTDQDQAFHIFTTDTEATSGSPSALYHFKFSSGFLYKSDGTSLGFSFPVSANAGTQVHGRSEGAARCLGWSFDASGNPVCILNIYDTATPTVKVRVARWNGSSWVVTHVTDSNGLADGSARFSECGIDKQNPDILWIPRQVSGDFQMFRYLSRNGGTSYFGEQLTSDDGLHVNPDTPLNAGSLKALWGFRPSDETSMNIVMKGLM